MLPVNYASTVDKLLDYVPDLFDKANGLVNRMLNDKQAKNKMQKQQQPSEIVKEEKKKGKPEQEDKNVRTRPKRTRNSVTKPTITEPTTILEYEYDETPENGIEDNADYTTYNDEYDD